MGYPGTHMDLRIARRLQDAPLDPTSNWTSRAGQQMVAFIQPLAHETLLGQGHPIRTRTGSRLSQYPMYPEAKPSPRSGAMATPRRVQAVGPAGNLSTIGGASKADFRLSASALVV